MAQILVRNIDDDAKLRLKLQAARHGRSLEAEARSILTAGIEPAPEGKGLGTQIVELFRELELTKEEHAIFEAGIERARRQPGRAATFED